MASTSPPKRNVAYTTYVSLVSQANTKLFQTSVTLAAGDITVHKDGGGVANIGTLPTEIGTTGILPVVLTATEMDADVVTVRFRDASGSQWADLLLTIHTVARNFDDLATQTSVDDLPTNAELATSQAAADDATLAAIAALNNISTAQVNAEVDTALSDVGLTTTITGRVDAAVSTRASQASVDDLPTNAELATSQAAADDATLAAIAALNNLSAAQVNSEVDTALADYDAPTFAELDARTDAIDAALVVIDDFLDTEITAITGFLDTEVAAVLAAVDTEVAAIKVVTDALTSAAATKLALSAGTIVVGAAIAGTLSTTAMTTNLTEATDDHLNGRIVIWTSGALNQQATDITDYNGTTKMLTFTAVTEAPTAGDTFIIV